MSINRTVFYWTVYMLCLSNNWTVRIRASMHVLQWISYNWRVLFLHIQQWKLLSVPSPEGFLAISFLNFVIKIGNRTSCCPSWSVFTLVIKQTGLPLHGRQIFLITCMFTDRIDSIQSYYLYKGCDFSYSSTVKPLYLDLIAIAL